MDERHVAYLRSRRSIPSPQMSEPSPDSDTLSVMLEIAARVPDHGKLAPWRFIIYGPEDRTTLVDGLVRITGRASDEKAAAQPGRQGAGLADTPLIVGVISSPQQDHPKFPSGSKNSRQGGLP
jgi:nitroreductase